MANPAIPLVNLHTPAQGNARNDVVQQDPGNEMWDMYLEEVKEDDRRISDAWKEDSNGILVFTGLFSATVGAFIIEFYKKLSPDSGDQTVALLGQISQQLATFPNSTSPITGFTANQPTPHSAAMIWVNAMWLISLVLSLTAALIATLLQQWARRYVEVPHAPSNPNHRARVRSFLVLGTEFYKMRIAVQIAPTLLHLSVYLFFGGLVVLFHTINKKVAIAVDVAVGLFGLAYIALTIIPCFDIRCPYRTPMSHILWYPWHAFFCFAALFLRWIVRLLHGCLVPPNLGLALTKKQRMLVDCLTSCESTLNTHWRYIKDGLRRSIINGAINAPKDSGGDRKIVTGMFNTLALGDKSKFRKFAAIIPKDNVLDLIPPIESGRIVLREPLLILLRSCVASIHVAGPDEDIRKRSLLVCLDAIHHIAQTSPVPELNFVRSNFANVDLMRELWGHGDTAICLTSRSICALVARQVVREPLGEPQLRWLHNVTGEASNLIFNADIVKRDHMNLKSFVYGVLSNQVGDLATHTTSFKETLAILLGAGNCAHFQSRLAEEAGPWIQQDGGPQGSHEVVDKLRSMFPFLPAYRPPSPPAGP